MTPENSYSANISTTKDFLDLPFLFEHWYVAGLAEEFGKDPVAKILLGRSIVFYRTETKKFVAMENRCVHRSFPLSEGYVKGDQLVCRYHGIHFNADGSIARIPCQKQIPNRKVRTYPLQQIGMYIFIWMGDKPADFDKLMPLSFLDDPKFRTVHDSTPLEGNYLLMHDNLNDLTHFAFLHANTFPFGEAYLDLTTEVVKTPQGIMCKRTDNNSESVLGMLPENLQKKYAGKKATRWDGGISVSPGVFYALAPITIGEPDDPDGITLNQYVMHYFTPETKTTSHYWWSISNDFNLDDDDFYSFQHDRTVVGFEEDVLAIKLIQETVDRTSNDVDDLVIAGDRAGMLTRRTVLNWVKEEYGDPVAEQTVLESELA